MEDPKKPTEQEIKRQKKEAEIFRLIQDKKKFGALLLGVEK